MRWIPLKPAFLHLLVFNGGQAFCTILPLVSLYGSLDELEGCFDDVKLQFVAPNHGLYSMPVW